MSENKYGNFKTSALRGNEHHSGQKKCYKQFFIHFYNVIVHL